MTLLNAGCVAAHAATNDTWRCFFAEATLPFITTPLFVTQDLVDSWQMAVRLTHPHKPQNPNLTTPHTHRQNILRLPCDLGKAGSCNATVLAAVSAFRSSMVAAYAPLTSSRTNGGYLSTCLQHCHQNIDAIWTQELVANTSVRDAFMRWWTGAANGVVLIDGEFGSNAHCVGSAHCAAARVAA